MLLVQPLSPPPPPPTDVVQPDVPLPQQPAGSPSAVAVYIAKYTYKPSEMSPNQQPLQELSLTAGDYLYVFGEMDEDGFYQGQLMSGESGLVPSNFIQEVEEGGTLLLSLQPHLVKLSKEP